MRGLLKDIQLELIFIRQITFLSNNKMTKSSNLKLGIYYIKRTIQKIASIKKKKSIMKKKWIFKLTHNRLVEENYSFIKCKIILFLDLKCRKYRKTHFQMIEFKVKIRESQLLYLLTHLEMTLIMETVEKEKNQQILNRLSPKW